MQNILNKKYISDINTKSESVQDINSAEFAFLVLNNTPCFIAVTDVEDGKFLKVNNYAERVLGYSRTELIGNTSLTLGIWVDPSERIRIVDQIKVCGIVEDQTAKFRRKDGKIIYGRFSVTKFGSFLIFNMREITNEIMFSKKLEIYAEKYKAIVENSYSGILVVDQQNKIILVNKKAKEILEYTNTNDLLNKNIVEIFSDYNKKISTLDIDNKNNNKYQQFESLVYSSSGEKRLCQVNISWYTDGKANIEFIDITDNVIMANNLSKAILKTEAALEKAEEASKAKSQFLANMSHEIKNPLHAIKLAVDMIKANIYTNPGRSDEYSDIAKERLSDLTAIVNNILDFSKMEKNNLQINYAPFSLDLLLNKLQFYILEAETKKIKYEVVKPQNLPKLINGDKQLLEAVLINLIGNAFKFTDNGYIRLIIDLLESTSGSVKLKFQVEDTGIGISKENISKLFTPFTQLDSSFSKKHQGSGLGLSIAQKIITTMKSSIDIESELNKGSRFSFVLDFDTVVEQPAVIEQPIKLLNNKHWPENKLNILVAEDEAFNAVLLENILKEHGYSVTLAYDGIEALKYSFANKYDLIFMDGQLPLLDGYQAIDQIRTDPENSNNGTNIIFCSGYIGNISEEKNDLLKRYNIKLLGKPFDIEDIRISLTEFYSLEEDLQETF